MAKPPIEPATLRTAVRGERPDGAAAPSPPPANSATGLRAEPPGLLSAIGWSAFGSMRRGWVILILTLLGWAVLVAVVLAIVSLF